LSFLSALKKEHIVAKPGFNRWLVPPASVAIHLCIGSVYSWSAFNDALERVVGVAAPSAVDWSLGSTQFTYTLAIVFLGLSAAIAGHWLEKVGPRMVGFVAACCWGGGFIIGGLGILEHNIYLLYLGYGVLGGCGLGLGYVSPVATLVRWFPDRRGMATGMAIMGFGGGAMIGFPLKTYLIEKFYVKPDYVGAENAVDAITNAAGERVVEIAGSLQQVVLVGANEVQKMIVPGEPGFYLVGTGSSGLAETFFTLGVIYFVIMSIAAFSYRIPAEGWKPEGWEPPTEEEQKKKMITTQHVHINQALKTPQFYLLWIVLCFNVSAGIGVLGAAKTLIRDVFDVSAAFAVTYGTMISVFNMVGRFFWASMSDYLGRKNTYYTFFILGILLYGSIPIIAEQWAVNPATTWLVLFYAATMIIFTMYGGGFATIPAYLADIFGTKYVGGIHGRLLTAWSAAGVIGPMALNVLREKTRLASIGDLSGKVSDESFFEKFGAGKDQLEMLVEAKTVTLGKLMDIAPAGTIDPSVYLYNSTMYMMVALLAIALVSNFLIRPVHSRHHMSG
tara:strand:- start:197 stop:1876 length:1680 start_codon:yes stop_codon:yes gene_type:complete